MSWWRECCCARPAEEDGHSSRRARTQSSGSSEKIVPEGSTIAKLPNNTAKFEHSAKGAHLRTNLVAFVGPVCWVATLACVAGSAASTSTCFVAVVCCSAPALFVLATRTQWGRSTSGSVKASSGPCHASAHTKQVVVAAPIVEDGDQAAVPVLRLPEAEAAAARARGEDPHAGQRLNYLAGTSVPFEPLLQALMPDQRARFLAFEESFPRVLAACEKLDRSRFFQEPDRFTLLLFLQADAYNIAKATARLVNTIVWRQQSGFEDFVDNPDLKAWSLYQRLRVRRIVGYDRNACPLSIEPLGEFFGHGNGCKGMSMKKWLLCYAFEISLQQAAFRQTSIREGRAIHRVGYIGELAGLRMWQAKNLLGYLRELTKGVETHFPECVGHVVLINAPSYFSVLYNVAKKFLDKKTSSMVSIHSGVPCDFLRETFGVDALPVQFGGRLQWQMPRITPYDEAGRELGIQTPYI